MTTEPKPRSSTDWLNEELDLHALSQSTVWKDYLAHVEKARARQVLYEASIPQDRDEAIRQVWSVLHPDDNERLKGIDLALRALTAIHMIARHELDSPGRDTRDAVVFFAWEASHQLREAIATLEHVAKLIGAAYQSEGSKHFKIIHSRSFRVEIEHAASGRRFETSVMKESFSKVVASLWLKPIDTDNVAASCFDSAKSEPENITLKRFMARKFGTLGEWEPFETWFVAL